MQLNVPGYWSLVDDVEEALRADGSSDIVLWAVGLARVELVVRHFNRWRSARKTDSLRSCT
jgi:hypothetical protein